MADYCKYYRDQCGGALPYYEGFGHQKGHGLGNIFKGVARGISKILPTVGKAIGKQALNAGLSVMGDVIRGQPFKKSLKNRAIEGGANLIHTGMMGIKRAATGNHSRPAKSRKVSRQSRGKKTIKKKTARKVDIFD